MIAAEKRFHREPTEALDYITNIDLQIDEYGRSKKISIEP
jgi:hypothetical protein